MKHFIEIFDGKTEEFVERIELPASRKEELANLMNWQAQEDEIYVYDLAPEQLRRLEEWTGKKFEESIYDYQLVCID